ncbi:Glutamine--fructose-6-phosphate aminotransferase [isomerizing] [Frankliniella fusca]|uniref:Glutamine--fructose-6-phosphate aminotransferase [isomerizing] n=1 Tax=Frankliniella fusca TaxID=407009 RepID=A0AAE1L8L0_9NEOP|nr:Glutamine--fructose-6-phosphate aminotransferase [isomerizing] [Frankliniella fusca]
MYSPCVANDNQCFFSSTSLWEFVQHLYRHLENGIRIMCPVNGCTRKKDFQKVPTFQVHLSQEHPDWRAEGCPKEQYMIPTTPAPEGDSQFLFQDHSLPPDVEESMTDDCDVTDNELLNDGMIFDSIAKFYLHLYAENLLPAKTIQEICDNLIFLTEITHSRTKLILLNELKNLDIPQHKVNPICNKVMMADLLYTSHQKKWPGPSFTSDHLRRKYFADNFGFENPIQINLQENDPDSKDTLQYVSIPKSLTKLLQDKFIEKEIEASFLRVPSTDNVVRDYYDGSLFQSEDHPPKEIHINIYQESFNPVLNALCSAKNKFKDLVVYFTICNFRAHLRSRVLTKHLIIICRELIFKKFGAKKCLGMMMEQLKKLEAGWTYVQRRKSWCRCGIHDWR